MESSPLDIWKHLLLAAILKAAQKQPKPTLDSSGLEKRRRKILLLTK
jgi:hypothetical protein